MLIKCLILFLLACVNCAPIDNNEEQPPSSTTTKPPPNNDNNNEYDLSQFSEVYDQRQNGSENYRVSLNGVVLMLAPAAGLLHAASLLDFALFEGEYPDLEELLNASNLNVNKPEDLLVVKPEATKPPPLLKPPPPPPTSTAKNNDAPEVTQENMKRKFKIPGLIRPFVGKPSSSYY